MRTGEEEEEMRRGGIPDEQESFVSSEVSLCVSLQLC
jgi:hypothetical protein